MDFSEENIAKMLYEANKTGIPVGQSASKAGFTLKEAYDIQCIGAELKIKDGNRHAGYKLGFTGKAKREQLNVDEVIWGHLDSHAQITNRSQIDLQRWIAPKIEPELAFLVKKSISTKLALDNVLDYIEGVAPALEIADSRYSDFKFSVVDIVSDNSFAGAFIVGDWHDPYIDLNDLSVKLWVDNQLSKEGLTTNIMGNPLLALTELSRLLADRNITIGKGEIIMAGAVTTAEILDRGMNIRAEFQNLGEVIVKT